ncbi:type II toxin-antitoxin system RelE/ParE family toxin [Mucilaginibacter sp. P19]|uniref:type II toxin-antitoxin system RelE/ParE family toxin n=1 Tax=Mucilaginibacter sp. P19 TaxID=3423947 RepID=UPI003D6741C5
MSFKILPTPAFVRELKKLSKKYISLKKDLTVLIAELVENPKSGTPLGNNCYKIRMAITSKNKGKSAGARIITYVQVVNGTVYLLSIYDKSDLDNISDSELTSRIKDL